MLQVTYKYTKRLQSACAVQAFKSRMKDIVKDILCKFNYICPCVVRRNQLNDLTCSEIIIKLDKERSMTKVTQEFGIKKIVHFTSFQITNVVVRKVGGAQS